MFDLAPLIGTKCRGYVSEESESDKGGARHWFPSIECRSSQVSLILLYKYLKIASLHRSEYSPSLLRQRKVQSAYTLPDRKKQGWRKVNLLHRVLDLEL